MSNLVVVKKKTGQRILRDGSLRISDSSLKREIKLRLLFESQRELLIIRPLFPGGCIT